MNSSPQKLYFERYANAPAKWVREILGVELWSKQREILESVCQNRRTVVPSGHACGKTFTAACCALFFLLTRRPAKVISTAPTWRQVEKLLWSEINTLFKTRLAPKGAPGEMLATQLRIRDDWFSLGVSPAEAVSFQGFHSEHVLVILDEAPGVKRDVFEGADSLMSAGNAHMLMIGNPIEPSGFFYEAAMSPDWHTIPISCLDTPIFSGESVPPEVFRSLVSREWVDERRTAFGEDSALFRSKVLGEFPDAASDSVIPLSFVEAAIRRQADGDIAPAGLRHLGVDSAWQGDDETVFAARFGNGIEILETHVHRDPMHVVGRALQLCQGHEFEVCSVDSIGLGAGILARLQELKREGAMPNTRIVGVSVAERAKEPDRFPNRRSELWWALRDALHPDDGWLTLPDDDRLRADLTQATYRIDSKGRTVVEGKDEMRKRLGRSPDYADAVMLALSPHVYGSRRAVLRELYPEGYMARSGPRIPTMMRLRDMRG